MTRKYTKDHEWIVVDGNTATVGITAFAAAQLGDVVFVEVPAAGKTFTAGQNAAVVESVKAASEVYAPVSGTITAANENLTNDPATVNNDPLGAGWFFKMTLSNPSELDGLMSESDYAAHTSGQ